MTYGETTDADRAAWQAVWDSGYLTESPWDNARIWRSVSAALEAYKGFEGNS